ncbi:MAG: MlaC/ttg2D family ABC transporter substrate-binding protein [Steroidobacteraceae bacterium]
MKFATAIAAAAFAAALVVQPVAYAAAPSEQSAASFEQPSQMVQSVANEILKALDGHRAQLRHDPQQIRAIVDKYLMPYFDSSLAADLVLGRFARQATPAQKQRFIQAFKDSLIKNYGEFIVDFHSNTLTVYPTHVKPGTQAASVRTFFTRANGSKVPVLFQVYMTPQGWKVFDLNVEGVSYVTSYRADLAPQFEQYGIDAVIKRLEHGEKPSALNKH